MVVMVILMREEREKLVIDAGGNDDMMPGGQWRGSHADNQLGIGGAYPGKANYDCNEQFWVSASEVKTSDYVRESAAMLAVNDSGDTKNIIPLKDWQPGWGDIALSGNGKNRQGFGRPENCYQTAKDKCLAEAT